MGHSLQNWITAVFLPTKDLKASIEWYGELLNIPVKPEPDSSGIHVFRMEHNGTGLLLDANIYGFPPMAMYDSQDIEADYAFVKAQGYRIIFDLFKNEWVAYFNFLDLGGNNIMACWSPERAGDVKPARAADDRHPIRRHVSRVFAHVADLKSAVAWYSDSLGRPLDPPDATRATYTIGMRQGADLLLDTGALGGLEPVRFEKLNLAQRVHPILSLEAADLEKARQHVKGVGGEIVRDIETREGVSHFLISDPNGNVLMAAKPI